MFKQAKVIKRQLLSPNKSGLAGSFFKPCINGLLKFARNQSERKT